jgi:transcriptional regulator with XRE-family HTH domain
VRSTRHVVVVDNSALARKIGDRIRRARLQAKLTQAELAKGRYTSAYISALERGLAKPSMAALSFIAERLSLPVTEFLADDRLGPSRLEADIQLASGQWQEALDRYQSLLETATDRRARAEVLRGMAEALYRLDRGQEAIGPASESAELFTSLGQLADAAWSKYWLSSAHYATDTTTEARSLFQELLDQLRGGLQVAPDFRFRVLTALAHVEVWDGQTERALNYMEEARALTEGVDLRQRAAFMSGLAVQYRESGDLERALRAGIESLGLYRAMEAGLEQAALENNLALTYLQLGSVSRAAQHVQRARDQAERHGDRSMLSHITETEAQIAWAGGDVERAEEYLTLALADAEAGGFHRVRSSAFLTRARMARERSDEPAAQAAYESALSVLRERGPKPKLREALAEYADMLTARGELAEANQLYAEALGRAVQG